LSTGFAELKYCQASDNQLSTVKGWGRANYDVRGEQRYNGRYMMNVNLNATSFRPYPRNDTNDTNDSWLGCICDILPEYNDMSSIQNLARWS
jgi:hypothetical protein